MKKPEKKENKTSKGLIIGGIIIIVFFIGLFIIYKIGKNNENNAITKLYEPLFTKEGELAFIKKDKNDIIKEIDIEIADNEEERAQGLMWRRSMSDSVGMLFVFDKEEPQSFWMKNTYMPLDIIFINKLKEIVTIHDYAAPLSEWSIPSEEPAQFVIEVNAGFCYKYKINKGDGIKFVLHK